MAINFISNEVKRKIKRIEKKQKLLLNVSKASALIAVFFLFLSFAPSIWYSLSSKVDNFSKAILVTVVGKEEKIKESATPQTNVWQPAVDPKLSRETLLTISSIKVETKVNESTYDNYEDALKLGVWRVPDFGTPIDRNKPVILAAHRFGYLSWSNIYRRKNSFYNLPKLKEGDLIELVYKQRKFTYEVYSESRGEEITDYSANLILYTCETLNSNIRIFKYARLLQI